MAIELAMPARARPPSPVCTQSSETTSQGSLCGRCSALVMEGFTPTRLASQPVVGDLRDRVALGVLRDRECPSAGRCPSRGRAGTGVSYLWTGSPRSRTKPRPCVTSRITSSRKATARGSGKSSRVKAGIDLPHGAHAVAADLDLGDASAGQSTIQSVRARIWRACPGGRVAHGFAADIHCRARITLQYGCIAFHYTGRTTAAIEDKTKATNQAAPRRRVVTWDRWKRACACWAPSARASSS